MSDRIDPDQSSIPVWLDISLSVLSVARHETNDALAAVAEFSVRGAPSTRARFAAALELLARRLGAERQANHSATLSVWREVINGRAVNEAQRMTSDQFAALMLRDAIAREQDDGD
jgi:hypothetical protein